MGLGLLGFGNGHATNTPTYFDIRLEASTLRLPREDEDANYGHLEGTVVLCLNKPLYIHDIKLHIRGKHHANWRPEASENQHMRVAWQEVTFYHQVWSFLGGLGKQRSFLCPGNYEFPFSISLKATMPESVEGLEDCYIRYDLNAEISSSWGLINKIRNLRVIKPPYFLSFLEPEIEQSIEKSWADKIMYQISIPGRAFLLDNPIKVDFKYVPLRKDVHPASIQLELVESHAINPRAGGLRVPRQTRDKVIADKVSLYEAFHGENIVAECVEQWHVLSHMLSPSDWTESCLPSRQTSIIDISHSLRISIKLRNPDGHISEITASFPISMCYTPEIKPHGPSSDSPWVLNIQPPPPYPEHLHDQPYHAADILEPVKEVETSWNAHPMGCLDTHASSWLEPPCYNAAISSVVPRRGSSPSYCSIATACGG